MDWVNKLIEVVQRLGALTPAAIFALVAVAEGYLIWKTQKDASVETLKRLDAWQASSKAEDQQTEAIEKMAEVSAMTAQAQQRTAEEVKILATLIDERIPKRSA